MDPPTSVNKEQTQPSGSSSDEMLQKLQSGWSTVVEQTKVSMKHVENALTPTVEEKSKTTQDRSTPEGASNDDMLQHIQSGWTSVVEHTKASMKKMEDAITPKPGEGEVDPTKQVEQAEGGTEASDNMLQHLQSGWSSVVEQTKASMKHVEKAITPTVDTENTERSTETPLPESGAPSSNNDDMLQHIQSGWTTVVEHTKASVKEVEKHIPTVVEKTKQSLQKAHEAVSSRTGWFEQTAEEDKVDIPVVPEMNETAGNA